VLAGEAATAAADMWAVGVMLHKAIFRTDPQILDGLFVCPQHDDEALCTILQVNRVHV
jgi:hypothetical protein